MFLFVNFWHQGDEAADECKKIRLQTTMKLAEHEPAIQDKSLYLIFWKFDLPKLLILCLVGSPPCGLWLSLRLCLTCGTCRLIYDVKEDALWIAGTENKKRDVFEVQAPLELFGFGSGDYVEGPEATDVQSDVSGRWISFKVGESSELCVLEADKRLPQHIRSLDIFGKVACCRTLRTFWTTYCFVFPRLYFFLLEFVDFQLVSFKISPKYINYISSIFGRQLDSYTCFSKRTVPTSIAKPCRFSATRMPSRILKMLAKSMWRSPCIPSKKQKARVTFASRHRRRCASCWTSPRKAKRRRHIETNPSPCVGQN